MQDREFFHFLLALSYLQLAIKGFFVVFLDVLLVLSIFLHSLVATKCRMNAGLTMIFPRPKLLHTITQAKYLQQTGFPHSYQVMMCTLKENA